jgi:hypothetical protein
MSSKDVPPFYSSVKNLLTTTLNSGIFHQFIDQLIFTNQKSRAFHMSRLGKKVYRLNALQLKTP